MQISLQVSKAIFARYEWQLTTDVERSKLRIIAGPGVSTSGANPFLLNAEEEKVVKAKQRDFRHDLRVPRR